jgi:hypothetical protein
LDETIGIHVKGYCGSAARTVWPWDRILDHLETFLMLVRAHDRHRDTLCRPSPKTGKLILRAIQIAVLDAGPDSVT